MSEQLVLLDLSSMMWIAVISGSDSVQLVLKPLSESWTRLILLMWVWIHDDGVGLEPRQNQ